MSGLYSMPSPRAPRLAAAMMLRPSPRAEVDDEILRRDAREVEHLLDQRGRRRHPDDVLARLPRIGLELAGGILRLGERNRGVTEQR
jgi:hypothetical protein